MTESQTTDRHVCSACDGKGTRMGKIGGSGYNYRFDWFLGVMTLGMSPLMSASNRVPCKVCDGKGYLDD